MVQISQSNPPKMDRYLGMLREDDTTFSEFVDKGSYYEAFYDKPVLLDYVTRVNRFSVNSKPYLFTGTLTSGTQLTVNDTTKTFGNLAGKVFVTTGGTGKNQAAQILSSTNTSLTFTFSLEFPVDNTTTYAIIDATLLTHNDLNSIYAFYLSNDHAVVLPQVLSDYNGSSIVLYNEVATAGRLIIITQPTDSTDKITKVTSLDNQRELVYITQHFTEPPHYDTLYTNGLQVGAVAGNTASYDVTTTPNVYKEINGSFALNTNSTSRFELIPTSKLEYTSTIPRLLDVTALINAQVISTQNQLITARFMYFNKANNTTTEIPRSAKSATLSGTGDTTELTIKTKVKFSRFDRIWVEVKNDNAARTFRILDSVIII